jgi:hypothetical protein
MSTQVNINVDYEGLLAKVKNLQAAARQAREEENRVRNIEKKGNELRLIDQIASSEGSASGKRFSSGFGDEGLNEEPAARRPLYELGGIWIQKERKGQTLTTRAYSLDGSTSIELEAEEILDPDAFEILNSTGDEFNGSQEVRRVIRNSRSGSSTIAYPFPVGNGQTLVAYVKTQSGIEWSFTQRYTKAWRNVIASNGAAMIIIDYEFFGESAIQTSQNADVLTDCIFSRGASFIRKEAMPEPMKDLIFQIHFPYHLDSYSAVINDPFSRSEIVSSPNIIGLPEEERIRPISVDEPFVQRTFNAGSALSGTIEARFQREGFVEGTIDVLLPSVNLILASSSLPFYFYYTDSLEKLKKLCADDSSGFYYVFGDRGELTPSGLRISRTVTTNLAGPGSFYALQKPQTSFDSTLTSDEIARTFFPLANQENGTAAPNSSVAAILSFDEEDNPEPFIAPTFVAGRRSALDENGDTLPSRPGFFKKTLYNLPPGPAAPVTDDTGDTSGDGADDGDDSGLEDNTVDDLYLTWDWGLASYCRSELAALGFDQEGSG